MMKLRRWNQLLKLNQNKSLLKLEDAKQMTIDAISENRELMRKLFEHKQKEFYWLPDLSMAGFATKKQIKKNMIFWHSNSGKKIQKERTINWKNPNYNGERHREEKDLEKWNN